MSFLLDRASTPGRAGRTGRPPGAGGDVPPSMFGAPLQAALRAAAGGLVPVAVPVVAAWVLGAGGQATWAQTVRLSLGLWLLAQHAGLAISGGHVGLVPIGLALVPFLATWFAGRRLARTMDPRADRIAAGATRAVPAVLSWRVLAVFVGAYGLVAALASMAAGMPGMRPVSAQAVVGAVVVAGCGGGLGAADYRFGGVRGAVRGLVGHVPAPLRPALRPAVVAQVLQLGAGAALVAVMLVVHFSGVTALHRALDPGLAGTAVLTLGEVMLLPNLAAWACAATAGPGFAIGTGTSVTVATSQLGPLPAIPVLAALPAPGALPPAAVALLAVPVLAGVVAGLVVVRSSPGLGLLVRLAHAGAAASLSGVGSGLLAWLSGGPIGPGRLAQVGPQPLLTGAAAGLEVALGALVTVLLAAGVPRLAPALGDAVRRVTQTLRRVAGDPGDDARSRAGTASDPGS